MTQETGAGSKRCGWDGGMPEELGEPGQGGVRHIRCGGISWLKV
jgi:hypothetical protein